MNPNDSNINSLVNKIKSNYLSIILGILVLLVIVSTLTKPTDNKKVVAKRDNIISRIFNNNPTPAPEVLSTTDENKTYTVKKGDNLWIIAQNQYQSGYNYIDIAKVNKIKDPNTIEVGQKLIIPDVKAKMISTTQIKTTINTDSYTVKKGDHLWKIAVSAYGDGFAWSKIAKVNKITNPNLIEVGQKLQIPR